MKLAFDELAKVLFEAGILTEPLLRNVRFNNREYTNDEHG
jgi:hypothetical protein